MGKEKLRAGFLSKESHVSQAERAERPVRPLLSCAFQKKKKSLWFQNESMGLKISCNKSSHVILSGISVSLRCLQKKTMFLLWHRVIFGKCFLGWVWFN